MNAATKPEASGGMVTLTTLQKSMLYMPPLSAKTGAYPNFGFDPESDGVGTPHQAGSPLVWWGVEGSRLAGSFGGSATGTAILGVGAATAAPQRVRAQRLTPTAPLARPEPTQAADSSKSPTGRGQSCCPQMRLHQIGQCSDFAFLRPR